MEENITAGELMIPISKYPIVSINDTLLDAVEEMDNIQIDSGGRKALPRVVLVFDHSNELVGVIRRRDIFRGLEPGFLVKHTSSYKRKWFDVHIDPNLSELTGDATFESIKRNSKKKVKEIMLPIAQTIDYDDHITKIISTMVEYNISMIPVTKNDRVVGVVRSADALHFIAHSVLNVQDHFRL
ncbi:MAG: CBS domain-containing protein [Fibrobacteria bacterium]|nr:CBS domain-containing protein [Fibrobacteria bacterium]